MTIAPVKDIQRECLDLQFRIGDEADDRLLVILAMETILQVADLLIIAVA
jgi:hypothetical protein